MAPALFLAQRMGWLGRQLDHQKIDVKAAGVLLSTVLADIANATGTAYNVAPGIWITSEGEKEKHQKNQPEVGVQTDDSMYNEDVEVQTSPKATLLGVPAEKVDEIVKMTAAETAARVEKAVERVFVTRISEMKLRTEEKLKEAEDKRKELEKQVMEWKEAEKLTEEKYEKIMAERRNEDEEEWQKKSSHAVDVEVQTDNGWLEDVVSDTATATAESVRAAVGKVHEEAMKIKEKDVEQMKREHEVQVKKINDELERAQQERNEAMKHVTDWNNLRQECDGLRMESASWEKECKRERKHCQEWEMKCVEGRIEIMELEEALMARGTDSEHEQEVMMTGRKKRSGCSSKKQSKAQRKTVLTRKSKRMRMKQLEKSPTTLDFEFVGSSEEDDEQTQAMQRLPWYARQRLLRNKPKKHLQDEEYFDDLMMAAQDPFFETAVNDWLMTIDPMAAVGPVPDEDAEE